MYIMTVKKYLYNIERKHLSTQNSITKKNICKNKRSLKSPPLAFLFLMTSCFTDSLSISICKQVLGCINFDIHLTTTSNLEMLPYELSPQNLIGCLLNFYLHNQKSLLLQCFSKQKESMLQRQIPVSILEASEAQAGDHLSPAV